MKKVIYLVGALSACFFLAGCQNEEPTTTSTSSEVNTAAPEQVEVYFARHGKTMLNTAERSQGWIDAPLTPAGIAVAEDLGRGLADVEFDAVYSSDSGRAIETATLVLENNGQEELLDDLTTDKRLREFNFGTFEGMINNDMMKEAVEALGKSWEEYPAEMEEVGFIESIKTISDSLNHLDEERLAELGEENGVPADEVSWQAEAYQTVEDRVTSALDDIVANAEKEGQDTILVTSHGMTIATLVAALDETAEIPPSGLKNASVCKIVYKDGAYTVESVNDLSYIEKGAEK